MDERKPFYRSKKWWTAIIAALVPVANKVLGWELDSTELATVIIPLIAYVLGEAWTDASNKGE